LAFVVVHGCTAQNPRPRLSITFIGYTNIVGLNVAKFSVTNTGNAGASFPPKCSIEVQEPSTTVDTGCRASVKELAPGKGDVIEVFLPQFFAGKKADNTIDVFLRPSFAGRWRAKCFCAQAGLRSRWYESMWHGKVAIVRNYIPAKWIPRYLTQLPLDVTVTSDWIAP
jgi:hypothetical protein